MKKLGTKGLILLAILGAWALLLRLLNFPILPTAPFLKMDLSDLMVLMGMLTFGPKGLVVVAFIRDCTQYLIQGGEAGIPIGAFMSFVASLAMFLPGHYLLKYFKHWPTQIRYSFLSICLCLGLTLSMSLLNYYFALPIYIKILNFPISDLGDYILSFILPFNLIKGIILGACQYFMMNLVEPYLIGRGYLYYKYYPMKKGKAAETCIAQNM